MQSPLNLEAPPGFGFFFFSKQALSITCVSLCVCVCKLPARIRWGNPCARARGHPLPRCHKRTLPFPPASCTSAKSAAEKGGLWASRHLAAAGAALPADKPARQGQQRSDLLLVLGCCCCGSGRGCCNPPPRIQPGLPSPGGSASALRLPPRKPAFPWGPRRPFPPSPPR